MKWIGQHIWDFISRFRNDVYLEDIESSSDTRVLVVNADTGKVSYNTGTGGTGVSDKNFIHTQSASSSSWVVTHNLNKYPSVTVVDSAGTVVIGAVDYNSLNQATLTFNAPFGGKAYFN